MDRAAGSRIKIGQAAVGAPVLEVWGELGRLLVLRAPLLQPLLRPRVPHAALTIQEPNRLGGRLLLPQTVLAALGNRDDLAWGRVGRVDARREGARRPEHAQEEEEQQEDEEKGPARWEVVILVWVGWQGAWRRLRHVVQDHLPRTLAQLGRRGGHARDENKWRETLSTDTQTAQEGVHSSHRPHSPNQRPTRPCSPGRFATGPWPP